MKKRLKRRRWKRENRSWKQYWRRKKGDADAGDYDWEWLNTDEVVDWEKDTDGNLVEDFAVEGVGVVVERRRALLRRTRKRNRRRRRWKRRRKAKKRRAARQRRTRSP